MASRRCPQCGRFAHVQPERSGPGNWIKPRGRSCARCQKARTRAWQQAHPEAVRSYQETYNQRLAADPQAARARRARNTQKQRERRVRDPELRERERVGAYARYLRMRHDPVRWAEHLERQRIEYRLKAEQEGREIRPTSIEAWERRNARERSQWWTVEPEPLAAAIREWERSGGSHEELARASGVPARRIYQVMHGGKISFPVADCLAVALGTHIDALYEAA